jgi:transcriptional regulator with PAS, ATPase and Fis domain
MSDADAAAPTMPFDDDDASLRPVLDRIERLEREVRELQGALGRTGEPAVGAPVTLDHLQRRHIEAVLAGSQTLDAAARTLGIDSSTLYRKRKAYGL